LNKAGIYLNIDAKRTIEKITAFIRDSVAKHSAEGVVLGLSGGIDSAVLAALAVHSIGNQSVQGLYLYDRDSHVGLSENVCTLVDWLGIKLERTNIEPDMKKLGIYGPLTVRLVRSSKQINRFYYWWLRSVLGETPFLTSLRAGCGEKKRDLKISVFKISGHHVEAAFNGRHRFRRLLAEKWAEKHNYLLLGAANRSEFSIGWFVKGGIDDLMYQPLVGLYKTQIKQLAVVLHVPDKIQNQTPSPDMMPGISDEIAFGICYDKIDVALDYINGGLPASAVEEMNITDKELDLVRKMNRYSTWKREGKDIPPPVDGGPKSDLRAIISTERNRREPPF